MRRVLLPCLALLATTISTEAWARRASSATFYARPGSTVPFSAAVRAGDTIYVSGQIGLDAEGKVPTMMTDSARGAMESLRKALSLAGADFGDVVKCTVMLTDMSEWAEFNAVYIGYFKPGHLPARSAMGVTSLAMGATVEVECVAYKPRRAK